MFYSIRIVASLLVTTVLLLLGVGLLNTLIPLRSQSLGFSVTLIGALTSVYYVGFFVGTFTLPALIHRIGHIRAFSFCATLVAALVLLQPLSHAPWVWLVLRVFQGLALVGLYMIIESWLNVAADPQQRNSVFSIYMMLNLGALAAGQQLLRIDGEHFLLFSVVAILFCLATLPLASTRQLQPDIQSVPRVNLPHLFRSVPTAMVSALLSGLVMGALWGLLPVYAHAIGFAANEIGTYMSIAIAGGALMQWPLGHLSNRVGRRPSLIVIGGGAALIAVAGLLFNDDAITAMALIFAFGGLSFAVYPIAVAHLVDYLPQDELLSGSSGVLLIFGIGSALGPLLAGALMNHFPPWVLFAWFAALNAVLAAYAAFRYVVRWRKPAEEHFVPMVHTTPAVMDLHPETEDPDDPDSDSGSGEPADQHPG